MRLAIGTSRVLGLTGIVLCALLLSACTALGGQQDSQSEESSLVPVASTAQPGETPTATESVTPTAAVKSAATTPTPGGNATVEVSPREVTVGEVTLTMSFEPARHMFDQAGPVSADPAQQSPDASQDQRKGSAVFAGGMLRVTGNFDPSQSPPADSPEGMLRHVVVQAKTKEGGQVVPYLEMTMDVLLDGRPVIFDQALVPMAAVDKEPRQPYYGNNVKFPRRGAYQVFVRMQRNPLLGGEQPQAAQFNLSIR